MSRTLFAEVENEIRTHHATLWAWYRKHHPTPNPVIPATGNDKFFWRRVFDHDPRFAQITDKLTLRDWIKTHKIRIALPKVIWQGGPENIPALEEPAMLKVSRGPATPRLIQPGQTIPAVSRMVTRPNSRLFLEKPIYGIGDTVHEYKLYTFGERIERLVAIYGRTNPARRRLTADVYQPTRTGYALTSEPAFVSPHGDGRPLPDNINAMTAIAAEIGSHFDHVRVDLYSNGTQMALGELTLYNLRGRFPNDPDGRMTDAWDLTNTWFLTHQHDGWRADYAQALRGVLP